MSPNFQQISKYVYIDLSNYVNFQQISKYVYIEHVFLGPSGSLLVKKFLREFRWVGAMEAL